MPGGRGITVVMTVPFDIVDGAMWTSSLSVPIVGEEYVGRELAKYCGKIKLAVKVFK